LLPRTRRGRFAIASSVLPRELMEGSFPCQLWFQMVGAIGVTLIPDMAVQIETTFRPPVAFVRCSPRRDHAPQSRMVWRKDKPTGRNQLKESHRRFGKPFRAHNRIESLLASEAHVTGEQNASQPQATTHLPVLRLVLQKLDRLAKIIQNQRRIPRLITRCRTA